MKVCSYREAIVFASRSAVLDLASILVDEITICYIFINEEWVHSVEDIDEVVAFEELRDAPPYQFHILPPAVVAHFSICK